MTDELLKLEVTCTVEAMDVRGNSQHVSIAVSRDQPREALERTFNIRCKSDE